MLVELGLWFRPLGFQQDYRIPVNSALTGNDRDYRISDYLRFGFPVLQNAVTTCWGDEGNQ